MTRPWLLPLIALLQAIAGMRVIWRMASTAGGERIVEVAAPRPNERVTAIVPVLNERRRLALCLEGLMAQPAELAEILVVDGGSTDGAQVLVAEFAARDGRIRLIDAAPIPSHWNGKAHGLQVGLDRANSASTWILTVDADVRPEPNLVRSLLAHAGRTGDALLGVATAQRLSGAGEGIVHPALLTTLVYRFGIPGHATRQVSRVQANGQCSLFRRGALEQIGGFALARTSLCEDVTVARALAAAGHATGFYESDGLVDVAMYESWQETWRNWTRSLPMRDQFSGLNGWIGLGEVTLVQGLPLPVLLLTRRSSRPFPPLLLIVNAILLMVRLGVLIGTARAYPARPWTYWLSPLADLPASLALWRSALQRQHMWRGRILIRDDARTRTMQ